MRSNRFLVVAAIAAMFVSGVSAQDDARSDDARPFSIRGVPDVVLLARTCVSERSWAVETDDCVIIAEVVRARVERRGGTFRESLVALAPRLHGGTIERRRWLLDLDEDAHRPAGWSGARWTPTADAPGRRDAWIATLDDARAILADEHVSPCEERPHHWGSRADVVRRVRAGYRWRDARCPGAELRNRAGFLYRPRVPAPAPDPVPAPPAP